MTVTTIEESELQALYDYTKEAAWVRGIIEQGLRSGTERLRFLGRYVEWNGWFGSGVATLAGKIGRGRALFRDEAEPVPALADRSVLVASYFFDAARDEFDDRDTQHRDTHRCLAQALLKGVVLHQQEADPTLDLATIASLLSPPFWLNALCARVAVGYGNGTPDDHANVFRAIGYHIGSEVLADQEFSLIDAVFRADDPELVEFLRRTMIEIAGQRHAAYQWLSIHSGHGGGVEAEHFAWATEGARLAFQYVPAQMHGELRRQVHLGFLDFARDHREFFEAVMQP